jgi:hypothetical protein
MLKVGVEDLDEELEDECELDEDELCEELDDEDEWLELLDDEDELLYARANNHRQHLMQLFLCMHTVTYVRM